MEQQYNVRVARVYDYRVKCFRHEKNGPVFVKEDSGKVRAYLLHPQVNRKP